MDRLPLAWRPGLVGAALVLAAVAVARPASVRRTVRRVALLATRAGVLLGELVLLLEHRTTRRRRLRRRPPLRWMARLSAAADRKLIREGSARCERIGRIAPFSTSVLAVLAVATFAPSAAWVATDRWPDNPFARVTRSAFSGWNGLEDRLVPGSAADVAAEQVAGPSTSTVARALLSWTFPGVDEPVRFGDPDDHPLAADLDGDGNDELVAYTDGVWRVAGWADELALGIAGDVPVPGDYDGDGAAQAAVFRPATGEWLVDGAAAPSVLGQAGDVPVPAPYAARNVTTPAVFRPSTGEWLVGGAAPVRFGEAGDVPVPGDYDGDGLAEPAVYRPSTGEWWVMGAATPLAWGAPDDVPVPGAWFGADRTVPAVYRPSNGELLVVGHEPVDAGVTGGQPVVARRSGTLTVAVVGAPA